MSEGIEFATVIPVGPSEEDQRRTADLLESLLAYEPYAPLVVLVDDALEDRGLARRYRVPESCLLASVHNPRQGRGVGPTSGLAAGLMVAMKWIQRHAAVRFVLKLDTDALVIGPFAEAIARVFAERPEVGMVGLYDTNCDGSPRDQGSFRSMLRRLRMPLALWRRPIRRWRHLTCHLWGRAAVARRQIRRALAAGYPAADFILGGAYAISHDALGRMIGEGYLDDPLLWLDTNFSEDVMFSMYVCAVRRQLLGMAAPGEPFGVQHYGLPFPPEELVAHGYSLIHSLKGDPVRSEAEIREFFRQRRAALPNFAARESAS